MNLHHLEWLIGELVPDSEMVVYGVLPYTAVDADRVIEQLWVLAGLEVGQADEDLAGAERVRQAFGSSSRPLARGSRIGRPLRRDLLKDLRHNRGQFTAAIGDKSVRRGLT